jgi:hypothetical protein
MKIIFFIFFIILTLIKNAFSSLENITNIKYYLNQICSYNGFPTINGTNNTVICLCEDKYVNEPREEEKKYIHNQFIQCTYRKKKRFKAFFLAAITPFGLDYFYLGYFLYFIIIAVINITIIVFNFISIVLNYQLEKKNEEEKRKLKLKKNTNKFDIRNLAELNDRCVKNFNLTSKILIIFMLLFWISNAIVQGIGFLNDINGVPTENDMGYLFQTPDR